jgi:chemotaxis family two-component system sensor kinase Cph1
MVIAGDLPKIYGNESQLSQLFQNLISNAIKYREKQSPKIEIGCTEFETEWLFSVRDNGIGIDPKFSEKIFIIFQRLHNRN